MAKLEMSSDELRAHLYTSLRGKGILDSLKVSQEFQSHTLKFLSTTQSQLRNRLATELQNSFGAVSPQHTVDKQLPKAAAREAQACAMSVQVANSIIAEHMKKAGFEYSLSVFLPEAGLNMDKVYYIIHVLYDSGTCMYPDRGWQNIHM
jgi:oral-facial-digital syndrome 1 protein